MRRRLREEPRTDDLALATIPRSRAPCNVEYEDSEPVPSEPIDEDATRAANILFRDLPSGRRPQGSTCEHQRKRRRKVIEPQKVLQESRHAPESLSDDSLREAGVAERRREQIPVHQLDGQVSNQRGQTSSRDQHNIMWRRLFEVVPREFHDVVEKCKRFNQNLIAHTVKQKLQINVQSHEIIRHAEVVKRYMSMASATDAKLAEMRALVETSRAKVAASVETSEARVAAAEAKREKAHLQFRVAMHEVRKFQAKFTAAEERAYAAEHRATLAELKLRRARAEPDAIGVTGEEMQVAAPIDTPGSAVADLIPPCMHCNEPFSGSSGVFLLCGNNSCNKGTHMRCAGHSEEPEFWYCCPECEAEDLKD